MAKKKGGGGGEKGGGQKPKSAVETLATLIASGALGDEAKEKVKEVFSGDSNFFSWWQRRPGESMVSTDNVLKALGLIVGYEIYNHADPLEGSKADNAAILVAAIALGMLLIVPQSNELGAHFKNFEQKVFLAIQGLKVDEQSEIMKWLRELSNRQEGRIAATLANLSDENLLKILQEQGSRDLLKELAGDDPESMTFDEAVKKVQKAWKKYRPYAIAYIDAADETIAGGLRTFRGWLNSKGVRR